MAQTTVQESTDLTTLGGFGELVKRAAHSILSGQHVLSELSSASAHFDGLIDSIERAGWEVERLERVKYAFDTTAQKLVNELLQSYPDMTEAEQHSFLEPFYAALQRFAGMTQQEKRAFRSEYNRFVQIREQATQQFVATSEV